jgi:hypothetical protein
MELNSAIWALNGWWNWTGGARANDLRRGKADWSGQVFLQLQTGDVTGEISLREPSQRPHEATGTETPF